MGLGFERLAGVLWLDGAGVLHSDGREGWAGGVSMCWSGMALNALFSTDTDHHYNHFANENRLSSMFSTPCFCVFPRYSSCIFICTSRPPHDLVHPVG